MENIIKAARELGRAIQDSELYKAYDAARKANDDDKELQEKIGNFNLLRMSLGAEMGKEPDQQDKSKIECLNTEMRQAYEAIMATKGMKEFEQARQGMDVIMNLVNDILGQCMDGMNPDDASPIDHSSCNGDCSCCGSDCH